MINYLEKLNKKGEIYLTIKVRPGAPKTELKEILANETLKIDVSQPPEKNKANQELIKFLAKNFSVSKNNVKIISGQNEKTKLIKVIKDGK